MDAVISCTSAPVLIIEKEHINEEGKKLIIFDLALPRDIDEKIKDFKRIELYDIDDISSMDDENKKIRKERMEEFRSIINKYIDDYLNWKSIKEISPIIQKLGK